MHKNRIKNKSKQIIRESAVRLPVAKTFVGDSSSEVCYCGDTEECLVVVMKDH